MGHFKGFDSSVCVMSDLEVLRGNSNYGDIPGKIDFFLSFSEVVVKGPV